MKKLVVGVTGGVGTGKTSVVREFRKRGASVIDLDELARRTARPGSPGLSSIRKVFGPSVFRGRRLDRRALGRLVFSSPRLRKKLEKILHPPILALMKKKIRAVGSGVVVVVEAPLLFEAGLEPFMDVIVVVSSSAQAQRKRIRQRDHLSVLEARARIASQKPLAWKKRRADVVLENNGSWGHLKDQCGLVWKRLLTRI